MEFRKSIQIVFIVFIYVTSSFRSVSQLNTSVLKAIQKIQPTNPIHSLSNKLLPSSLVVSLFKDCSHDLFYVDSSYYVSLDGTGNLYKLTDKGDSVYFKRIDSTSFVGYNFGDIKFTWKNKMYSYGGYGYWRNNGMIRVFNYVNGQWDLVQLDREIPAVEVKTYTWLDAVSGQLYLYNPVPLNDFLNPATNSIDSMKMQVWSIDLNTGKCVFWGTGSSLEFTKLVETPMGILCNKNYAELVLMDLKNNRLNNLSNNFNQNYLKSAKHIIPDLFLFRDSIFYLMNSKTGLIDSVTLRKSDVLKSALVFYEPLHSTSFWKETIFGGILLVIMAGFLVNHRSKKNTPVINSETSNQVKKVEEKAIQHFEEKEVQLLKLFYDRSLSKQAITIDDLNFVLGIKHKNESVQKKNRSEILQKMNLKLMMILETEEEVLIKKRLSEDKRSFTYHLNVSDLQTFHDLISQH